MRISKDNNKVVDLLKVQFAELMWVTHAFGVTHKRSSRPTVPTVNGALFECDAEFIPSISDYLRPLDLSMPATMLQLAKSRKLLDVWYPELTLQLSSNHSLIYTGQKALDLWKAWNARIFSKPKKKEKQ